MNAKRTLHLKRLAATLGLAALVIFSLFTAFVQPGARLRPSGTLLATPARASQPAPVPTPVHLAGSAASGPLFALGDTTASRQMVFKPDPLATLAESLRQKERELAAREEALKKKESYLEALRAETATNLARIEELYNKLERQSVAAQQKREKDLAKWRNIYQAMSPEKAGPIIQGQETEFALELLSQMEPKKAAKILEAVEPLKAVELARRLGGKQP